MFCTHVLDVFIYLIWTIESYLLRYLRCRKWWLMMLVTKNQKLFQSRRNTHTLPSSLFFVDPVGGLYSRGVLIVVVSVVACDHGVYISKGKHYYQYGIWMYWTAIRQSKDIRSMILFYFIWWHTHTFELLLLVLKYKIYCHKLDAAQHSLVLKTNNDVQYSTTVVPLHASTINYCS